MKVTLKHSVSIKFRAFTLRPGVNEIHQEFLDNAEPIFHLWVKRGRIVMGGGDADESPEGETEAEPDESEKRFGIF